MIDKYSSLSLSDFNDLCRVMGFCCFSNKLLPDGPIALKSRNEVLRIVLQYFSNIHLEASIVDLISIFDEVHSGFSKEIHAYTKPLPDAIDFLQRVSSKNVLLSLVTSDKTLNALSSMEFIGISHSFNGLILGSDNYSGAKSTGAPLVQLCQMLGADPKSTVVVGDAKMDYLMSINGGAKDCILVASGQTTIEELKTIGSFSCNSLNEVEVL